MYIDYKHMSTSGLNKIYRDAAGKGNHAVVALVADALRERGINVSDKPMGVKQLDDDYFTDDFADPLEHWDNQKR